MEEKYVEETKENGRTQTLIKTIDKCEELEKVLKDVYEYLCYQYNVGRLCDEEAPKLIDKIKRSIK